MSNKSKYNGLTKIKTIVTNRENYTKIRIREIPKKEEV